MKLTPRAQATLRNLIICRQTQIDTRMVSARGTGRRMLQDEQDCLLALWDEIEALAAAGAESLAEVVDFEEAEAEAAKKARKRPGRPKKQPNPDG